MGNFHAKNKGGIFMDTDNQIIRQQIIEQVAKRIIEIQEELRIEKKYDGYTQKELENAKECDIEDYKENHGREKFNKALNLLHMTKQKKYLPIFSDITYIIALSYNIYKKPEPRRSFQNTLKNLINENYQKIDANELASFFMPFYDTKNWDTLNSADKIEKKKFNDFLREHKETLNLFIELWKLNIRCYPSDLKLLCTSFYNHNDLPPKERYQKLLDAYEK